MRHRYIAYGLVIDSEIELPELGAPVEAGGEPDLTIGYGEIQPPCAVDGDDGASAGWIDPDHFWFHAQDVAHYIVRHGKEIIVMPQANADIPAVRLYILGSACGVLLQQRGMLVLHGNAIRLGDGCLVCVGVSGAGKSTLAAGFLKRGFDVISDDVVPVDPEGRAIPGFPRIKLWQDAADQLGMSTDGMIRIYPGWDKYNLPMKQSDPYLYLPIRWIYLLTKDTVDDISIQRVTGMQRFSVLRDNSYHFEQLNGPHMLANHLTQCSDLAGRAHISKVVRPSMGFSVDGLIDKILEDVASSPPSGKVLENASNA